jgi:hypothetical protein
MGSDDERPGEAALDRSRRRVLKHLGVAAALVGARPLLPTAVAVSPASEVTSDRLDGLPLRGRFGAARGRGGEESSRSMPPSRSA